jgi:hypothetical protein
MNIASQIQQKKKTPYTEVAETCGCTSLYVGKIARGERKAIRGKGLQVKIELEKLLQKL